MKISELVDLLSRVDGDWFITNVKVAGDGIILTVVGGGRCDDVCLPYLEDEVATAAMGGI